MANLKINKKEIVGRSPSVEDKIDRDLVRNLAKSGLSIPEIAMCLQVKPSKIENNKELLDIIKQSHGLLIAEIKQKQVQVAVKEGSVPMLKWLGTNYLGQSDKPQEDRGSGESHNSQFEGVEFVEYDDEEEVQETMDGESDISEDDESETPSQEEDDEE